MTTFYKILLAWAELDLAIAKSTGRNPVSIAACQRDVDRWSHALLMAQVNA